MVERLKVNAELLNTYIANVEAGEVQYLGEIAAKCRLLTLKTSANRPLLQTLACLTGHGLRIETGALPPGMFWQEGIGGGEMIDIEEWLDMMAGAFQTPSSGGEAISTRDLVQTWAEQSGAAHEDWGQEEVFHIARTIGVHVQGMQATQLQLLQIAIKVRSICLNYLDALTPEIVAGAEVRRQAELEGKPWPY